jgi:hypothetical protein
LVKAWRAILAALVIFLAGAAAGGFSYRLYHDHPPVGRGPVLAINQSGPFFRVEFVKRLESQLVLTPQQRESIEQLVHESQERMRALWDPIAPQAHAETKRLRERILATLTPMQKARFDELNKRAPRNRENPATPSTPRKPPRRNPARETLSNSNSAANPPAFTTENPRDSRVLESAQE